MPRKLDNERYVTKNELKKYFKEIHNSIKSALKEFKKWDVKQDKTLLKKRKKK